MADIDFKVNADELKRLHKFMLLITDKLDLVTAISMTKTGKIAQEKVRQQTPKYIDNPVRYTLNSTFVKPAKPDRLSVIVGFKDYSSSGVPAAKYLQPQVAGGKKRRQPFENLLTRKGYLKKSEFAIPTGNWPLKFNSSGNVPAAKYVQVLSSLGALREAGSNSNATPTSKKKKRFDYLVGTIYDTRGIWAQNDDSIVPVFIFVNNAKYSKRFPVKKIILDSFVNTFPVIFERLVDERIAHQAMKAK